MKTEKELLVKFLKDARVRCSFQTYKDMSEYANRLGTNLSPETFRLFELGERVPSKASRLVLAKIYNLNDDAQFELERLCLSCSLTDATFEDFIIADKSAIEFAIDVLQSKTHDQAVVSTAIKKLRKELKWSEA
jgi:transcriptional regulator with XRE-family HTH domain